MLQRLVDYVIRPKRVKYSLADDLGPGVFLIDNKFCCERIDFEIKNKQDKTLKCSLFHRSIDKDRKYPLIVYCHGNSGNRTESYDAVCCMLRLNILVLSFDFAGCGLSDGSYISLGHNEQNDLAAVFNHIKTNLDFIDQKRIGVWGRSMGAVTSLLFAASNPDPNIRLLILDSPFTDLSQLMKEYIDRFKIVSKIAGNYIYKNLRKKILDQAGFDFETVSPIKVIEKCKTTALFIHGTKDSLIPINHSKELFEKYPAEKMFLEVNLGHNDIRSEHTLNYISEFIIEKFTSSCVVQEQQQQPEVETTINKIQQLPPTIVAEHIPKSPKILLFEHSDESALTIPEEKVTNREYAKYFNVENENDDENEKEDNMEESVQSQSQPFRRGARRHNLYFKTENVNQSSEVTEMEERQEREQNFVRGSKTRKSVELTVILASRKPSKELVFLKSGSATIAVTQCDAEQVASMVNIFEKMNEDELESIPSPGLKLESGGFSPKKPKEADKFREAMNDFCNKSFNDDAANITADDMTDCPTFAKSDVLEPFIQAAAGNNFELFRQRKENFSKTPS